MQLGPDENLVGVITRPLSAADDPLRATTSHLSDDALAPTCIFLNAGVIHRVGPHRLHVVLARQLASRGLTSLRLDLSGIGDSRPVPGALSFRESAVVDTRSAMDRLEADTRSRRFILFGLCSGADNALATAAVDERVVGLVLVDPPMYASRRARARSVAARVRKLGSVSAVATEGAASIVRRLRARLGAAAPGAEAEAETSGGREMPPRDEYRVQLGQLTSRGVAILAVFSGALGERYNERDQLFEIFPELRGRVDVAYFPAANHTFTERDAQASLMSTVCEWMERQRRSSRATHAR